MANAWLLSPIAATMVWGWWLAALAVLGIAAFDGVRWRALPIGGLTVGLALVYCTTGVYWDAMLVGPVNLYSRDPGVRFDRIMQSYLVLYLGAVGAVVVVGAAAGIVARSRRARRITA